MNTLAYLIPIALFLGGLGPVAFLWALKSEINSRIWTARPGASSTTATADPKRIDFARNGLS